MREKMGAEAEAKSDAEGPHLHHPPSAPPPSLSPWLFARVCSSVPVTAVDLDFSFLIMFLIHFYLTHLLSTLINRNAQCLLSFSLAYWCPCPSPSIFIIRGLGIDVTHTRHHVSRLKGPSKNVELQRTCVFQVEPVEPLRNAVLRIYYLVHFRNDRSVEAFLLLLFFFHDRSRTRVNAELIHSNLPVTNCREEGKQSLVVILIYIPPSFLHHLLVSLRSRRRLCPSYFFFVCWYIYTLVFLPVYWLFHRSFYPQAESVNPS